MSRGGACSSRLKINFDFQLYYADYCCLIKAQFKKAASRISLSAIREEQAPPLQIKGRLNHLSREVAVEAVGHSHADYVAGTRLFGHGEEHNGVDLGSVVR